MRKSVSQIALQKVEACPVRHVEHFGNARWGKAVNIGNGTKYRILYASGTAVTSYYAERRDSTAECRLNSAAMEALIFGEFTEAGVPTMNFEFRVP